MENMKKIHWIACKMNSSQQIHMKLLQIERKE
jgi:hypothetical protein